MIDDYYDIKTPASEEPVSLAEAKEWTKQDEITVDDTILTGLIAGFRKDGEDETNRVFVERTFEGFFSGLECSNQERHPFILLRQAPLLEIESVEVSIDDSLEAVTEYQTKRNSEFSRLLFPDTSELTAADDIPYPIKVTFTAGYRKTIPVSSLTRSGTTVTVMTNNNHGLVSGMDVIIAGADQAEYNGTQQITVTAVNKFTYEIVGSPATPATGNLAVNFGGAPGVPEGIKAAIKAHLFFLYANRGDTAPESKKGMPVEVEHLYNNFRIINTF